MAEQGSWVVIDGKPMWQGERGQRYDPVSLVALSHYTDSRPLEAAERALAGIIEEAGGIPKIPLVRVGHDEYWAETVRRDGVIKALKLVRNRVGGERTMRGKSMKPYDLVTQDLVTEIIRALELEP